MNETGYGASDMSVGATNWTDVLINGVSRVFDVAAQVYIDNHTPYYQTEIAAQQLQAQSQQRMLLMALAGAAVLVVMFKGQ